MKTIDLNEMEVCELIYLLEEARSQVIQNREYWKHAPKNENSEFWIMYLTGSINLKNRILEKLKES